MFLLDLSRTIRPILFRNGFPAVGGARCASSLNTAPLRPLLIRAVGQSPRERGVGGVGGVGSKRWRSFRTADGKPAPFAFVSDPPTGTNVYGDTIAVYRAPFTGIAFLGMARLAMMWFVGFSWAKYLPQVEMLPEGIPGQVTSITSIISIALIPALVHGIVTKCYVCSIRLKLPPVARRSKEALTRFLSSIPPETEFEVTTLGILFRPKFATFRLSELWPAKRRMGLVNMTRVVYSDSTRRSTKWGLPKAIDNAYGAQEPNGPKGHPWAWHLIWEDFQKKTGRRVGDRP